MMSTNLSNATPISWQEQADRCWVKGDYTQAINLYEAAIASEPDVKSYYWKLGLILLLKGEEAEAQTTWLLGMSDGETEQIECWTGELIQVLQTEAERRETQADHSVAWALRQHLREIYPRDINNLLNLIELAVKLEIYTGKDSTELGAIELLQSEQLVELNPDLLMQVLRTVVNYLPLDPKSLEFAESCLNHVQNNITFIDILLRIGFRIATAESQPARAAKFAEVCWKLDPHNAEVLRYLAIWHQDSGNHTQGIAMAKKCYELLEDLPDKVFAHHLILRGLMNAGGYLEEAIPVLKQHELLLKSLIESQHTITSETAIVRLFSTPYYFPYCRDNPRANSRLRNEVARFCQKNIEIYAKDKIEHYSQTVLARKQRLEVGAKPLKIGYLSHCLRVHSVGWLARWLFLHHDKEKFQIYAYLINAKDRNDDRLENLYVREASKAYKLGVKYSEIAEQISEDDIDILVDLDSITLDVTCEVMALKLAPIQVTWLGWDASGLPAIDYYMADPYVLPEDAQDYYSEKIWRLPQTYIAVDGFEVAVPTIRRDELNIPSDAVVFLSAQRGYKYHPDTARLQMQILREVPNSYFLLKGVVNQELVKNYLLQLAGEEGVEGERLKFLEGVPLSTTHRANLGIADVVLDTYPYNGATTTLETLWMGIPMVTRVGQQFSSRNSYTMMMNAGITEGIAWNDKEYVEWGIRLGKDAALRQQISWKLRQSRQTAPLWNGKQFTREMEKAYEQMWQIYTDTNS
jgi:predicted O-linked N-acetylglucosamine transferase (SPINDLY family)